MRSPQLPTGDSDSPAPKTSAICSSSTASSSRTAVTRATSVRRRLSIPSFKPSTAGSARTSRGFRWAEPRAGQSLESPEIGALFFLWTAVARARLLGLDRLRHARGDCPRSFAFGEKARQKTLAFADPFHLERGRLCRLLQPRQSITELSRKRRYDSRASAPDTTRQSDRERQ